MASLFESGDEVEYAAAVLNQLQAAQEWYREKAATAASDATQLAAMNRQIDTMWKEVAFRQIIGLLPKNLNDLSRLGEARYAMRHVSALLERLEAPRWAYEYLLAAFRGEDAQLPERSELEEREQ
jgi:hypothetical protein